jgi:hypothetical protein
VPGESIAGMDLGTFVNWVTIGIWIVAVIKWLASFLTPSAKPKLIRTWISSPTLTGILIFIGLAASSLQWYLHRDYSPALNTNSKLETVTDAIFSNRTVEIDGKEFRDCHFHNATLRFHGRSVFAFHGDEFNGVVLSTDNPTVAFAWVLAKGVGFSKVPFFGPDSKAYPRS